ncbi:YbaN family protein [Stappia sp. MMSF_3263]|uniref:YbaN family protein n=1 Tax=Stappia sp. MMSF_3263 TaxID=3046693 RepID=UPI00273DC5CF|nr:YbaN family protein [Stappia sp. MMSF_3263]
MNEAEPARRSARASRLLYRLLGGALVAIGIVGAFLPLLPSTIFFIGATACFARSSPALEAWLVEHPLFGPGIRAWREERAIRPRAKLAALAGMAIGYVFFLSSARPGLPLAVLVALLLGCCAAYVATRPSGADMSG